MQQVWKHVTVQNFAEKVAFAFTTKNICNANTQITNKCKTLNQSVIESDRFKLMISSILGFVTLVNKDDLGKDDLGKNDLNEV